MFKRSLLSRAAVCIALLIVCAAPAAAQIEDQISAYTGANATGYLQPLADAFGADLNAGLFHSAEISRVGFHISLEIGVMAVLFSGDEKTFSAVTESGFSPERRVEAPTVVGPGMAKEIEGDGGTHYKFPGGFDLHSFAVALPQLRIGSVFGTEALFRYISLNVGDVELGDLSLFGFGLRHSISQHLGPRFPVDIAAGFFWQKFRLGKNKEGDDLLSTSAFSFGVQASKRFARFVVPYTALSYDTSSMDLSYDSEASGVTEKIEVDFEPTKTAHWTIGLLMNLSVLNLYGEYNIASPSSFSFGLGLGFGFGS